MARSFVMIGMALASAACAAPAAAQTVDSDVHCLLAANYYARAEKDPAKRQLSMVASIFYLGRLDARISKEQLKSAVVAQAKAMPASSLASTMNDCVRALAQKGVIGHASAAAPAGVKPPTPPAPKKK